MKPARLFFVLILPLILSSCFLAPGAFMASLDLKRDGGFDFAYKGEIVFQSPEDMVPGTESAAKPWADMMAICPKEGDSRYEEGRDSDDSDNPDSENRPCTRAEIGRLKADYAKAQAEKAAKEEKDAAQFAAMFGFNPKDEAANRKYAAMMMRYEGWKSVVYKGKGVFEVDYRMTGRIGHDFVFPVFPQGNIMIPFVMLRGQDKGSVRLVAPALIGGGLKAMASQMKMLGAGDAKDMPQSTRTRGTFTVTTEGEILTNNTADGPTQVAGGRRLVWEIDPQTEVAPEALIKLR